MPETLQEHLDRCERCSTQSLNLFSICPVGAHLLTSTSDDDLGAIRKRLGADARLGAVELDGQIHEDGYGHGV